VPGDLNEALRYRQWAQRLSEQSKLDIDKLQEKLDSVSETLLATSASYVEKKAWLAQLRRTGLDQQQSLSGWLGLHKKIGKGKGKHVARLKEEAKNKLVECRNAVPVWIMPLSRVTECFDLATTRFDVVILDEASQSDPLGLLAFALGRSVVVVGDHEQVSPYAVGQSTDRVNALIDEILTDVPNKRLYDGKTSVYDLARQSFGGTIRLLEHFRCVPDIIQFSNQLCYGGEIRPLREASSSRVGPHVVAHKVKNGKVSNGVNRNEALEIASLVSAICKLDEYEGCTIGVICMVGTEQALYIDSVLKKRLTISEYQQRRILCGNASQFQGDERDIIFLSIVSSPSDGPLFLRQRDDARKVFNVAASRARDQLWVVHSLNPTRDLKAGDLRLRLISHAEDPSALRPEIDRDRKKFRSELEKAVFLGLLEAGYRITQQYMVGECVIDLVVEDDKGNRVAVQCDGDRAQTMEAIEEEMARHQMLRRLGWDFIRVRGSEFFRRPEKTMNKVQRRLQEVGIPPVGPATEPQPKQSAKAKPAEGSLLDKVIKRAELIRSRWKDIPTPSAVLKAAAVENETTAPTEEQEVAESVE
jgi:very-short-patch-repair endonuclease